MQLAKDLDKDRQELAGKKIGLLMVRKQFDRRLRRLQEDKEEFERTHREVRESVQQPRPLSARVAVAARAQRPA